MWGVWVMRVLIWLESKCDFKEVMGVLAHFMVENVHSHGGENEKGILGFGFQECMREYIEEKGAGREDWNGSGVHVIGICIVFVGIFIVDRLGLEATDESQRGMFGFFIYFIYF